MAASKDVLKKRCVFDGCEKWNFARGYCAGHAAQIRRGVPLQPLRQPRPEHVDGYHYCSTCKQFRPEEDFGWDATRDEPKRLCLACARAEQKKYRDANIEAVRKRTVLSKWAKLGLTGEQYDAMFEQQQHRCAICGCERREYRALAVDHDHTTGEIRGLLCQDCNLALGQFKDDPELLDRAAAYLRAGGTKGA